MKTNGAVPGHGSVQVPLWESPVLQMTGRMVGLLPTMGLFGFIFVELEYMGRRSILIPGVPTSGENLRFAWNEFMQAVPWEPSDQQCIAVYGWQPRNLSVKL